ncbi:MAG: hypothetical protein MUC88_09325 [Planctomycetes bacterium]|jgi:hypothetical protein|nr:hypothetical protein [Planctomycetota bacterium]
MKSSSYSRTTALTLAAALALVVAGWPTDGRGQDFSRRERDRSRRDYTSRTSSGRSDSGRPGTSTSSGSTRSDSGRREPPVPSVTPKPPTAAAGASEPAGRITKPAESNAVPRPVVEYRPRRRNVQDPQWVKFEIITQRNMFSRLREPPRPPGEAREEPQRVMPNPESYLLLKGVVQENSQFIAFVEDKQSGSVLRLRQGDSVARGTVKSLDLDGLEYQFQDRVVRIALGFDLEGGQGAITAGDLASYVPLAPSASPGTPALPAADEAEILKRLMEQRKQQMGQ